MVKEELIKKYSEPIRFGSDGFVRLVDVMGDDAAIVQAARVSYGAGTKTVSDDESLIRYLMRHRHSSPLEMCSIKLHLRMPIDTARQGVRHRTAKMNEYSTRYSVAINSRDDIKPEEWRMQSTDNKQGSSGLVHEQELITCDGVQDSGEAWARAWSAEIKGLQAQTLDLYHDMVDAGVAREQARRILPLNTYTEMYWKIDLHNLLHYLNLRTSSHAQKEIRDMANIMSEIVRAWCPIAWQAHQDYVVNAVVLSANEAKLVKDTMQQMLGMLSPEARKLLFDEYNIGSKRERKAFYERFIKKEE